MGAQETGFDGTTRFSDYLPLADGTRLAYDLILPTIAGRPSEQPLPALFKYTPYLRAYAIRGEQEKSRVAELYRMPAAQRGDRRRRLRAQLRGQDSPVQYLRAGRH